MARGRDLGPHLQPLGVGRVEGVEDASVALTRSGLQQRYREWPARRTHHLEERVDLISKSGKSETTCMTPVPVCAEGAGDADQLALAPPSTLASARRGWCGG